MTERTARWPITDNCSRKEASRREARSVVLPRLDGRPDLREPTQRPQGVLPGTWVRAGHGVRGPGYLGHEGTPTGARQVDGRREVPPPGCGRRCRVRPLR